MADKRRTRGEGSVYFDKSRQRWYGQAWVGGRRRKVSGTDKYDVAAKLGRLIHGDDPTGRTDTGITVEALLVDWTRRGLPARNVAPSTDRSHRWAARLWSEQLGKLKAAELDVTHIETVLDRLSERYRRKTLMKALVTLRLALGWAQKRRTIPHNPAAVAELPSQARPSKTTRALDRDEARKLCEAMRGHELEGLYLLSLRCGLRPGEAAAVCTDALNFDADPPSVSVIRGIRVIHARPVLVDQLKTRGSRRTLAMPPDVADVLRGHLTTRINGSCSDEHEPILLFTDELGGPVWQRTVGKTLDRLCDQAGIERATPNGLRHSFTSIAAEAGLPPHHLADILGHTTTAMVDRYYRHRPAVIGGAETVEL